MLVEESGSAERTWLKGEPPLPVLTREPERESHPAAVMAGAVSVMLLVLQQERSQAYLTKSGWKFASATSKESRRLD
eukprot:6174132-Pleurochrysis_carterae.AAC.3